MIVILTLAGLAFAVSLFMAHFAAAMADRWQRRRVVDPDRARIARDISYSKIL